MVENEKKKKFRSQIFCSVHRACPSPCSCQRLQNTIAANTRKNINRLLQQQEQQRKTHTSPKTTETKTTTTTTTIVEVFVFVIFFLLASRSRRCRACCCCFCCWWWSYPAGRRAGSVAFSALLLLPLPQSRLASPSSPVSFWAKLLKLGSEFWRSVRWRTLSWAQFVVVVSRISNVSTCACVLVRDCVCVLCVCRLLCLCYLLARLFPFAAVAC